ncbi:MAG: hypothetical protein Q4B60_08915 [Erysipelotrichaceae bacterium]|nr:hypothetical protein [Erysipelotrichaceae bacterium]
MNNEYRWSYNYYFTRNKDWIKPFLIIFLIIIAIIAIALIITDPKRPLGILIEYWWVFVMMTGIFAFSVLLTLLCYKNGYMCIYEIKDNKLHMDKANIAITHSQMIDQKLANTIYLDDIRHLRLSKEEDAIYIRGVLTITTVYADKQEIDYVYSLLKDGCKNLKD